MINLGESPKQFTYPASSLNWIIWIELTYDKSSGAGQWKFLQLNGMEIVCGRGSVGCLVGLLGGCLFHVLWVDLLKVLLFVAGCLLLVVMIARAVCLWHRLVVHRVLLDAALDRLQGEPRNVSCQSVGTERSCKSGRDDEFSDTC